MSERGSWQRLLESRRHAVSNFFESSDDGAADDLEATLDRAVLDAAQRMDARAGHTPWLDVRVAGPEVGSGALSIRIMDELVPPIQAEIDAALPGASPEKTALELVGIGSGSAILRFQPKNPVIDDEDGVGLPIAPSVIDSAVRRVLVLHDAVEHEQSPELIAQSGSSELLARFQRLVSALESHDLVVEFLWRSPTADRRASSLTSRGRSYARSLFERTPEEHTTTVAGYVYEQSLRGMLKLKADTTKIQSHTYDITVGSEVLKREDLRLGSFVRAQVTERSQVDKLGRRTDTTYEMVRILGREEMLDGGEQNDS